MNQAIIGGLVLVIIGVLLAVFPKTVWAITEKWKSASSTEPTKQYLILLRIVSAASILFGILLATGILR